MSTCGAQVVTMGGNQGKRAAQLMLVLIGCSKVDVLQHAVVVQLPDAVQYDALFELFEEHAGKTAFAAFAEREGTVPFGCLIGELHKVLMLSPMNGHRMTGESPLRVVRKQASVPKDSILEVLARSGQEHCNIKLCQPQMETQLELCPVWAVTSDNLFTKAKLESQLGSLPHCGVLRTRSGRFLVRCLPTQLSAVRVAIASEDTRFRHAPGLVISRKWRITNGHVELSALRLSEALRLGHSWIQVPIGQSHSRGKAKTWTVTEGGDSPPPQDELLVGDNVCVVYEMGVSSRPFATMSVSTASSSGGPVSSPVPVATVARQLQDGMQQTQQVVTATLREEMGDRILTMVESRINQHMGRLQDFEKDVGQRLHEVDQKFAHTQKQLHAVDQRTQQVGAQVQALASDVEAKHIGVSGELKSLTSSLQEFAGQTSTQFAAMDERSSQRFSSIDEKMQESFGRTLISQLQLRKRPAEDADIMES
eukprot:6470521-Amphidinium_carterae.2